MVERVDVLILYASQTGNTARLARAVLAGVQSVLPEGGRLMLARDAGANDLLACRSLVLATPENFGYMAGAVKDFFDRTYYPTREYVAGLPFAMVISAGNDGMGAATAIRRIARGYAFREVLEAVVVRGAICEQDLAQAFELGATLQAGLDIGMF